jgi:A/G-specific adenine glycosylase
MLQQTRMEVVLRYFESFMARFPTVAALAAAAGEDVLAAWSGLGYYRRARMLHKGAQEVVARFGGRLPSSLEELRSIPGIGRYTAGAIRSVAWNEPAPIVDGNVARIVSRLFAIEEPAASAALMRAAWIRAEELARACRTPREFNQGLMELGALICRPRNPSCPDCPLREHCVAHAAGRAAEIPAPRLKKETREMHIPLFLVVDDRGRILMRKESGPLMNAMYHLPHGDSSLLGGRALDVAKPKLLGSFRHTVTTRKIEFTVYTASLADDLRDSGDEYTWIEPGRMAEVPHPSYVEKALRLLPL